MCSTIAVSSPNIALYQCEEEKSVDSNWPVVCRPAPEKASGSEQTIHNMVKRALSEERSTLH